MKGGADLLRAEIKNCVVRPRKVSQTQLLPQTPYYHVIAVVFVMSLSAEHRRHILQPAVSTPAATLSINC